jgi:amidase
MAAVRSAFAEYDDYDAVGLAELTARGEVHSSELVEAAIERLVAVNPVLNAVVRTDFDRARTLAAVPPAGAFSGVPLLVKDIMFEEGHKTCLGSVLLRDFVPEVTEEYLARVKSAGFVPLGRTSTSEFGLLPTTESKLYGPTHNPWSVGHSAGGSSGGSAAAVAAGIVPLALGGDGGGSIRIPASACGVFGLKPSRGRNPRYPAMAADYLSVDLALTRSVRDTAALLDVVHGAEPGSQYWAPPPETPFLSALDHDPEPLTVAFSVEDLRGNRVESECEQAVRSTAELLESLGHRVVEASPVVDGQAAADAFLEVWGALAAGAFHLILETAERRRGGKLLRRRLGDWRTMKLIAWLDSRKSKLPAFEPFTWELADRSRHRSPAQLDAAHTVLQRVSHEFGRFLEQYDVLLTPVLGGPPVPLGQIDQAAPWDELVEQLFDYVAFTPVANFTGLPAMSVPLHWNAAGLPIGSHFLGRFGDEAGLLQLAGQLERARPWAQHRPPVSAAGGV